ncbi:MAG: AgmX/PglI C-terminal domain-containing protein [Deltaproteobacteria bacterium]|nr:AgmX/PglI C-terminal domain-containing protein [Deltaproteobacteria bacterium]
MTRWMLVAAVFLAWAAFPPRAVARKARSKGGATARRAAKGAPSKNARCKDLFCAAQVVRMDRSGEDGGLSGEQVDQILQSHTSRIEPCFVEARRRDPSLSGARARVEVVVKADGQVADARVNQVRGSPLSRCVLAKLKGVRFPKSRAPLTVAGFQMAVLQ